jgi:hypothetical protein
MAYGTINADLMTTSDGVSSSGLYGFKNRIINGAMVIDQRNAGASVTLTSSEQYITDRFIVRASNSSSSTAIRSTTTATGFKNSLLITIGTGATAAGTNYIQQKIEGLNVYDLNWGSASAVAVTLSFWVRSSLTGTFGGALQNSAGNRSYPFTYTISSANTFEQKSITIAGDQSGTWLTDTSTGIALIISLGEPAGNLGTAGAWTGADYRGATGQTNLVATSGATLYITGVQLEKGSTATSFDYRPYGTEELLCQRYYYKHADGSVASNQIVSIGFYESSGVIFGSVKFPVTMRAIPTNVSASGTNYYSLFGVMNDQFNSLSNALTSVNQAGFFNASEASGTAGQTGSLRLNSSSAFVAFSAEL